MKYINILIFSFISIFISQHFYKNKKKINTVFRKLINLDSNNKSIKTWKKSPSYLLNYYYNLDQMDFDEWINKDNAHYLFEMARINQEIKSETNEQEISLLNKEKNKNYNKYISTRLGIYFIFVGIAGFALIYWALFWICLKYPICCYYPENDENILKILYLILVYVFYGFNIILIILSFIYSYKYNKRLNGIKCALERNYYNIKEGQIKNNKLNWPGLDNIYTYIDELNEFSNIIIIDKYYNTFGLKYYENINIEYKINDQMEHLLKSYKKKYNELLTFTKNLKIYDMTPKYLKDYINLLENINNRINDDIYKTVSKYNDFQNALNNIKKKLYSDIDNNIDLNNELNNLNNSIENIDLFSISFEEYKNKIINTFFRIHKHLKIFGVTLNLIFNLIYMIIISGIITFLSLYIFWKQKKLFRIILYVLWNICMAFTIYYFLLSGFLGMVNFGAKDSIGLLQTIFSYENLNEAKLIFEKNNLNFFKECIYGNGEFLNLLDLTNKNIYNYYDLSYINNLYTAYYNIIIRTKEDDLYYDKYFVSADIKLTDASNPNNLKSNFENIENLLETINKYTINYKDYWFIGEDICSSDNNNCCKITSYNAYQNSKSTACKVSNYKNNDIKEKIQKIYEIYDTNNKKIIDITEKQTNIKETLKNEISNQYFILYRNNITKDFSNYFSEHFQLTKTNENSNNLMSYINCKFIKSDLNATYKIILDFSKKDEAMVYIISFLSFFSLFFVNFLIMTLIRYNYEEEIEIDENKKIGSYRKNINSISSVSSDEQEYNQKNFKLRKRKENNPKYNKMSIFSKKSNSDEDDDD